MSKELIEIKRYSPYAKKVVTSYPMCNGCHQNIEEGYLLYLGKGELQSDRPDAFYCESCLKKYFKGYKLV